MRMKHWIEWGFGCFMGLLPLGAWILAHQLSGSPAIIGAGATRELLFFSLSTASTGLLSLSHDLQPGRSHLWAFGLGITILSAVLYGEFVIGESLHAAMRVRIAYNISEIFAVAALAYGVYVEGITQPESPL